MTVFLWGRSDDAVIASVAEASTALGEDILVTDGDDIESVELEGEVRTRTGKRVALGAITGMLVRPEGAITCAESASAFQTLSAWAELTENCVLNRPSAAASNRSKPYQLGLIAAAGFAVPDTLVTTNPDDVLAFANKHERVIYKSISGVRSIVALLDPDDRARIADVSNCPTQFQQFIAGADYRIHVVGDRVFSCRIRSHAVDYRYANRYDEAAALDPVVVDTNVAERCVALARSLKLGLAGVDLRLDPDGAWWCFEVNTAPGFIWFEQHTGLRIAAAVASELCGNTA